MWSRITSKANNAEDDTPNYSGRRKNDDQTSKRHHRSESTTSSHPTRQKAPSSDDRDRGFTPTSTSYSSTTKSPYPGTASASIASSSATASRNKTDEPYLPPGLVRNASLAEQMPKSRSARSERDEDQDRNHRSEGRKERSLSRDRKHSDKNRARSHDRSDKHREKKDKRDKKDKDRVKERGLTRAEAGYGDSEGASRGLADFSEQVGSAGFVQFPGQYDGGLVGGHQDSPAGMSSHVQDQFPGQFPTESTAPYRPPVAASEGRHGLAAEYYGDTGQSVSDQPGVRLQSPSLIIGAEPHLQAASAVAAPPPEPSTTGAVGAAASFFSGEFGADITGGPSQNYTSAGGNSTSFYQTASTTQSGPRPSGTSRPVYDNHAASAPAIPTVGAAAASAAAGYLMGSQSSSHQQPPHRVSSVEDGQDQFIRPGHQRPSSQTYDASGSTSNGLRPPRPGKQYSQSSDIPIYAAGAAGAAGLAAAAYQHNHNAHGQNPLSVQNGSLYSMAQRHRHYGPLSKFVDFIKDPDGVAQFEEYTEYIGVCRYCFAPGSSPRDAPRRHNYRPRRSNEHLGSSTRVDKESRYGSSDGEGRRKIKKSRLTTGVAGYGLAKVGESLFDKRHDFDDTYSVKSGQVSGRHESSYGRQGSRSPDRKRNTSHGVTRRSSDGKPHRRSRSKERVETGITSDGKVYKKESHGGFFGGPTTTMYSARHHSRSRSRSTSRNRKSGLAEAALGVAVGSSIVAAGSRRRSRSPPKKAFIRSKHRSREHSPEVPSVLRVANSDNRLTSHGSHHSPSSSHHHKSHKKEKKRKKQGFFNFGNGSSSSSDAALAFGGSRDKQRGNRQFKAKGKDLSNADVTTMGLGAAAAALALNEALKGGKPRRTGDLVAVKESKARNARSTQHDHKHRKSSGSGSEEHLWESASEDDSAHSDLAYGRPARRTRSQESLSSQSSGTGLWGWRWGTKKQSKATSKGNRQDNHIGFSDVASTGLTGAIAGAAVLRDNGYPAGGMSSNSNMPLQQVYPVPTSDPSRFDVARASSVASSNQPILYSRPGPIPIQHPQPIAQVSPSVYSAQAPNSHSYSAPTRPPVLSQSFDPSHPSTFDAQRQRSSDAPHNGMHGGFSRPDLVPSRDTGKDSKPRRRDSSPVAHSSEISSRSAAPPRRTSHREDSSAVRFDLTKEQEDKNRREKRHRAVEDEKPRVESERDEAAEQGELERERRMSEEKSGNFCEPEKETSWAAPAAAAVAATAVGVAVGAEISKSEGVRDERKARKRRERELRKDGTVSERRQISSEDVSGPVTSPRREDESAKQKSAASVSGALPAARKFTGHQDYAAFFTPLEFSSTSSGAKERVADVNADNDITIDQTPEIITVEPKGAHNSSNSPAYSLIPTSDELDLNSGIVLPWVPRLNLIEPTPPASRAGSTRGAPSPVIQPVDVVIIEPKNEQSRKSTAVPKVTWGEPQTREYTVITPIEQRNQLIDSPEPESDVDKEVQERTDRRHTTMRTQSPPANGTKSDHVPADYGDDVEFAATLAAGLEDTGFDPSIVVDDPIFRRRDSPPRSDQSRRDDEAQRVNSDGVEGQISERSRTGMPGSFDEDEFEPKLSKKDRKKKEKAAKRQGLASAAIDQDDNEDFQMGQDRSVHTAEPELEPIDTMQPDAFDHSGEDLGGTESKSRSILEKSKEDAAGVPFTDATFKGQRGPRDEGFSDASGSDGRPSSRQGRQPATVNDMAIGSPRSEDDGYVDARARSSISEPQNGSYQDGKISKAKQSQNDHGFYESPDEVSKTHGKVATAPSSTDNGDGKKHRKKSKRSSSGYDDTASVASSPAALGGGRDSKSTSKKEKERKRGLFGIFSKSTDTLVEKTTPPRTTSEEFDESKRGKRPKDQKSICDNDISSKASPDLDPPEDEEDWGKSHKRKGKKEKQRSSGGSIAQDSGRITQNLPAKLQSPICSKEASTGYIDDEVPSVEEQQEEQQPMSFLGMRQAIPPSPNITTPSEHVNSQMNEKIYDRPTSPTSKIKGRGRPLSEVQTSDNAQSPSSTSSPTAVPFRFSRPPSSPGFARSSSTASAPTSGQNTNVSPSRQKNRPRSTEFKSSTEFRPLWLVEIHGSRQEPAAEEKYPSLPSSKASSIHGPEQSDPEQDQDLDFTQAMHEPLQGEQKLLISTDTAIELSDLLDSQQPTPTASSFHGVQREHQPSAADGMYLSGLLDKAVSSQDNTSLERPSSSPERSLNSAEELVSDSQHRLLSSHNIDAFEDSAPMPDKNVDSLFRTDDQSSKGSATSLSKILEATAVTAGSAAVLSSMVGHQDEHSEQEYLGVDSKQSHQVRDNIGPSSDVDDMPANFDYGGGADFSNKKSKKSKKKDKKPAATNEVSQTSSSREPERMNAEEVLHLHEQDAQDAVDSWFTPPSPKNPKKDRKGKIVSLDAGVTEQPSVTAVEPKGEESSLTLEPETSALQSLDLPKSLDITDLKPLMSRDKVVDVMTSSSQITVPQHDIALRLGPSVSQDILANRQQGVSSKGKKSKGKKSKKMSVSSDPWQESSSQPIALNIDKAMGDDPTLDPEAPQNSVSQENGAPSELTGLPEIELTSRSFEEALGEEHPADSPIELLEDYVLPGKRSKKGKKSRKEVEHTSYPILDPEAVSGSPERMEKALAEEEFPDHKISSNQVHDTGVASGLSPIVPYKQEEPAAPEDVDADFAPSKKSNKGKKGRKSLRVGEDLEPVVGAVKRTERSETTFESSSVRNQNQDQKQTEGTRERDTSAHEPAFATAGAGDDLHEPSNAHIETAATVSPEGTPLPLDNDLDLLEPLLASPQARSADSDLTRESLDVLEQYDLLRVFQAQQDIELWETPSNEAHILTAPTNDAEADRFLTPNTKRKGKKDNKSKRDPFVEITLAPESQAKENRSSLANPTPIEDYHAQDLTSEITTEPPQDETVVDEWAGFEKKIHEKGRKNERDPLMKTGLIPKPEVNEDPSHFAAAASVNDLQNRRIFDDNIHETADDPLVVGELASFSQKKGKKGRKSKQDPLGELNSIAGFKTVNETDLPFAESGPVEDLRDQPVVAETISEAAEDQPVIDEWARFGKKGAKKGKKQKWVAEPAVVEGEELHSARSVITEPELVKSKERGREPEVLISMPPVEVSKDLEAEAYFAPTTYGIPKTGIFGDVPLMSTDQEHRENVSDQDPSRMETNGPTGKDGLLNSVKPSFTRAGSTKISGELNVQSNAPDDLHHAESIRGVNDDYPPLNITSNDCMPSGEPPSHEKEAEPEEKPTILDEWAVPVKKKTGKKGKKGRSSALYDTEENVLVRPSSPVDEKEQLRLGMKPPTEATEDYKSKKSKKEKRDKKGKSSALDDTEKTDLVQSSSLMPEEAPNVLPEEPFPEVSEDSTSKKSKKDKKSKKGIARALIDDDKDRIELSGAADPIADQSSAETYVEYPPILSSSKVEIGEHPRAPSPETEALLSRDDEKPAAALKAADIIPDFDVDNEPSDKSRVFAAPVDEKVLIAPHGVASARQPHDILETPSEPQADFNILEQVNEITEIPESFKDAPKDEEQSIEPQDVFERKPLLSKKDKKKSKKDKLPELGDEMALPDPETEKFLESSFVPENALNQDPEIQSNTQLEALPEELNNSKSRKDKKKGKKSKTFSLEEEVSSIAPQSSGTHQALATTESHRDSPGADQVAAERVLQAAILSTGTISQPMIYSTDDPQIQPVEDDQPETDPVSALQRSTKEKKKAEKPAHEAISSMAATSQHPTDRVDEFQTPREADVEPDVDTLLNHKKNKKGKKKAKKLQTLHWDEEVVGPEPSLPIKDPSIAEDTKKSIQPLQQASIEVVKPADSIRQFDKSGQSALEEEYFAPGVAVVQESSEAEGGNHLMPMDSGKSNRFARDTSPSFVQIDNQLANVTDDELAGYDMDASQDKLPVPAISQIVNERELSEVVVLQSINTKGAGQAVEANVDTDLRDMRLKKSKNGREQRNEVPRAQAESDVLGDPSSSIIEGSKEPSEDLPQFEVTEIIERPASRKSSDKTLDPAIPYEQQGAGMGKEFIGFNQELRETGMEPQLSPESPVVVPNETDALAGTHLVSDDSTVRAAEAVDETLPRSRAVEATESPNPRPGFSEPFGLPKDDEFSSFATTKKSKKGKKGKKQQPIIWEDSTATLAAADETGAMAKVQQEPAPQEISSFQEYDQETAPQVTQEAQQAHQSLSRVLLPSDQYAATIDQRSRDEEISNDYFSIPLNLEGGHGQGRDSMQSRRTSLGDFQHEVVMEPREAQMLGDTVNQSDPLARFNSRGLDGEELPQLGPRPGEDWNAAPRKKSENDKEARGKEIDARFETPSQSQPLSTEHPEDRAVIFDPILNERSGSSSSLPRESLPGQHEQAVLDDTTGTVDDKSMGFKGLAAAAGLGIAGVAAVGLKQKDSKGGKKGEKSKEHPRFTDLGEENREAPKMEENSSQGQIQMGMHEQQIDASVQHPYGSTSPLSLGRPYMSPIEDANLQGQRLQSDNATNRDSAVHVSDSPVIAEILPVHHTVRDSGYQDTETSPITEVVQEFSAKSRERVLGDINNPLAWEAEQGVNSYEQTYRDYHYDNSSLGNPLNVSVEVNPDFDVSISRRERKRGHSRESSSAGLADHGNASYDDNVHQAKKLQSDHTAFDDPREPSPVSSTTKDRSSVLFLSSHSTREELPHQLQGSGSPVSDLSAAEYSMHGHTRGLRDEARPVREEVRPVREEIEDLSKFAVERALQATPPGSPLDTNPEPQSSLFGGPIGISSDHTSPSRSPFGYGSPHQQRLNTITEYSPGDSSLHKKSQRSRDVESPERGHKSIRHSVGPRPSSQPRVQSPTAKEATDKSFISTDDLIARLSWPPVDEEKHAVDLERSKSRNTDKSRQSTPTIAMNAAKHRDSDRRSMSGASVRSGESINAIIRTPEQIRSLSGQSIRSSGTPPLRRVDRSISADLRLANKKSEAKGLAKTFEAEAELAIPSSSTYDPIKDKGKSRVRDMADVYEGWGDVHGASPISPTRPPSMRRRQSLQVLDLETKLDQLVSENRLLQNAKSTAEKNVEGAARDRSQEIDGYKVAIQTRDSFLDQKDAELTELRHVLQNLQGEVSRLTEANEGYSTSRGGFDHEHEQNYIQLQTEHANTYQQWQQSTVELDELRQQHSQLSTGMEDIVRHEVSVALEEKNLELRKMQDDLEATKEQVRVLQRQILASKSSDSLIITRDEDYFEEQCQQLCQHVQQWVLRFSKFSDSRACYLASEVRDETVLDRFENAILDGSDLDSYLADRVKRRDVFLSVVMTMAFEYIFTRYLFGMDREQRQKLKLLEKTLSEVGPATAVQKWRATTLSLLSKREAFLEQRRQDTEAVVDEIFKTLAAFLPPPAHLIKQIKDSLTNVMGAAVDLSIEMRTQRAEYVMLPPLQPEYDVNGDLARKVYFNASLMNERSGATSSNEALQAQHAVVRMVLFPLVVKKGDDSGTGDEEIVVCPAQVLTAKTAKEKKVVRVLSAAASADGGPSAASFAGSDVGMGNVF